MTVEAEGELGAQFNDTECNALRVLAVVFGGLLEHQVEEGDEACDTSDARDPPWEMAPKQRHLGGPVVLVNYDSQRSLHMP